MARVTSCGQCGAPHRPPRGVTRFRCDFCGTQNLADDRPDYEELVCSAPIMRSRALAALKRELLARGLDGWKVELRGPRWLPLWQAISRDGEEQVFAADPSGGPLDARMGIPAVPLLSREEAAAVELELPDAVPVDAQAAEQASLSLFADSDFEPRVLRLVWLRVYDLVVQGEVERREGLYVAGSHHIVLPGGVSTSASAPLRPTALRHYGVFLVGAALLAGLVSGELARAVTLTAWAGLSFSFDRWWRRAHREIS